MYIIINHVELSVFFLCNLYTIWVFIFYRLSLISSTLYILSKTITFVNSYNKKIFICLYLQLKRKAFYTFLCFRPIYLCIFYTKPIGLMSKITKTLLSIAMPDFLFKSFKGVDNFHIRGYNSTFIGIVDNHTRFKVICFFDVLNKCIVYLYPCGIFKT